MGASLSVFIHMCVQNLKKVIAKACNLEYIYSIINSVIGV